MFKKLVTVIQVFHAETKTESLNRAAQKLVSYGLLCTFAVLTMIYGIGLS